MGISAITCSNILRYSGRNDLPVWIYDVLDSGRTFNDQFYDWQQVTMANRSLYFIRCSPTE